MESVHQLSVLLVDQDIAFRTDLLKLLGQSRELRIRECDSTKRATAILEEEVFDVMVLDQNTLANTEVDFHEWMREKKIETPVIVLVSEETEGTAAYVLKPGVFDYIRKDLIVRDHLTIMIRGVRERFLFRRYSRDRAREEVDAERRRRMTESLSRASEAISCSISNGLAILLAESEEYMEVFRKHEVASSLLNGLSPDIGCSKPDASEAFSRLHHEVQAIAACIKSLTTLSNMLLSRAVDSHQPFPAGQENEEQNLVKSLSPDSS